MQPGLLEITKGVRSDIFSFIAWEIWRYTQYPTPEEYTGSNSQEHPVLMDTIENGFAAVSCIFVIGIFHTCNAVNFRVHGK